MNIGPRYKFIRGPRENYDPEGEHRNAIYFAMNTHEILMNGECFGSAGEGAISSVTVDENNILTVVYTNGNPDYTFDLNNILIYASSMPDDLVTPNTVGGIQAGTTAGKLKEKTISEVLDSILFPELQPTVTSPSASISFIGEFKNNGIYEVGSSAPKFPEDFITSFSRGISKIVGKEDIKRAGELIPDELSFVYYNEKETELPEKIILGEMSYGYQVHYDEGDICITSKGNPANINPNPLPSGIVSSDSIRIFGTLPYFCNGMKASATLQESDLPLVSEENNKLPLYKWEDTLVGCKFASEAATGSRISFEFPAQKAVTKVEFLNTVGGRWEVINPDEYIVVTLEEPKEIQGEEVTYKQLTTKENTPKKGALQLRFTLENV